MKRLLVLLLIPLVFACSSDNKKNDLDQLNLKGKVKSLKETTYSAVEKFGEPVRDVFLTHNKHFFDEVGFYKKSEVFSESGRLKYNWKYNYDDGILIESIGYDNGVPLRKIKYKFDGYGNNIEENVYEIGGELMARVKYEYDKAGKIIESNIYKEDEYKEDESIEKLKFKYDNDGNVIEESGYNEDGELFYKWNFKYENFDSNNNWLKSIAQDGKTIVITEREIEYYD